MYGQGNFYPQIGQGPLRPPPPHQPHVGQSQPAAPAQHGQAGPLYLNPTPPPPPLQSRPHVHPYSNTHQNIQWAPNMYNVPPQRGHHNFPPPMPFSPPPPPPPPPLSESGPSHSHSGVADADNVNHDLPPPPPKPRDENIVRKIEVLCQYIVKNGPDFEDMTLKKERKNPEFDFLFGGEPGSEAELAHKYFLWVKMSLTNKLQGQQHDDPSSADSDMDMEDDITQAVEEQGVEIKPSESPSDGSNLKESSTTTHIDSIQVSREPIPVTDPSKPEHDNSPIRLVPEYDSDESSDNLNETFLEDLSPAKADALSEEVGPDVQTHLVSKSLDSSRESETVCRKPDPESSQAANKSHKIEESTNGRISKQKKAQRVDEFGRLIKEGASESESDDARQRRNKRLDKRRRSRSQSRSRDCRSRSRDRRSRSRNRRSWSRDRRRRSPRRRKDKRSRSRSRSPRKRSGSRSPYRRGSEFGGRRDKGQLTECFDFRLGKCYRGSSCRYLHPETDKTDDYKSKTWNKEIPESNLSDLYEKDVIENVTPDRNDKSLVTLVAESEKAQEVTEAFDIENEIVEQQEQEQNYGNGTSWIQQAEPVHHNSDNKTPQTQNNIPNLPPPPTRNFNFYQQQQQQTSTFYQPPLFSAQPNTSWQPQPLAPLPAQLGVFQPNLIRPYIANLPAQHQSAPQFGGPTNQLQQQNMSFLSQPAGRMQPFYGGNANSTFPRFRSHYNPYASTFDQPLNSNFSVNNTFNQQQAVPVESVGLKEQYDPVFDSIEQPKSVQGINHEVVGNSNSVVRASESNKPLNLEEKKDKEEENDEYGETAGAVENGSPSEPIDDDETTTPPAGEVEIDQEGKSNSQGKNKSGKDSRSMKLFKNSLADFVKDVLKPSWRQGNMSKEAFKTIVKKTVDKVSGAMKAHQVPKSQSKINHYMDSNQRKLTKLVMGYVDKYVKS